MSLHGVRSVDQAGPVSLQPGTRSVRTRSSPSSARAAWARSIAPTIHGLARVVALKLIRRSLVQDEVALDRLLREATLASALNHPNIVTIYETGVAAGDRYVAMELIEGVTLRALAAAGPAGLRACWRSHGRSPKRWPSRTPRRSCTATSSPRT